MSTRSTVLAVLGAISLGGGFVANSRAAEGPDAAARTITLQSLLTEMIDRDGLTRFPLPAYRLREFSSYDRKSKTPDDPEGWFANKDNGQFIRVETNHGRQEWVIMDHQAAGAIVRSWMPDQRLSPHGITPVKKTIARIYLDGADAPAIEGHALDLFNGTGLVPPPLAHKSHSSAVSYLPIPYAKSCKVTLDAVPFYYIIACREYPAGTPVRTLTLADLNAANPTVAGNCKALRDPETLLHREDFAGGPLHWVGAVASQAEETISLRRGPAAVRMLSLNLDTGDPQAMRSLVLKIEFDGRPTVWCPVGEFFGTGVGINPFQDWYRGVRVDGTMTCRWVMPYRQSGKITLINHSARPIKASLSAAVGGWVWDDRTMYFHANWRRQFPVPTRPFSDWNYVTLQGRGVYVGDTLTVMNPVARWWGEGDAKLWVDGEKFPSMFSTGTEDYYGYSWGGKNTGFYQHPFQAQVRVGRINQLRSKPDPPQQGTIGYSTETRVRSLDAIPCTRSLQVDMEVWHFIECDMDYAAATYWYGFADTKSNRGPEPKEAAKAIREIAD